MLINVTTSPRYSSVHPEPKQVYPANVKGGMDRAIPKLPLNSNTLMSELGIVSAVVP